MNLAWRDIRHKLGRFILTCLGLSLLLGVVITMAGIYRGQTRRRPGPRAGHPCGPLGGRGRHQRTVRRSLPHSWRHARDSGAHQWRGRSRLDHVLENIQIVRGGRKLRLQVVGYEPGRPGGPVRLIDGRDITRSHYELIADRQTGFGFGEVIRLGRYDYTVVGMTSGVVTLSGDSIVYMSLRDAQQLQFDLSPPAARRETARGAADPNRPRQRCGCSVSDRCAYRGGRGYPPLEAPFGSDEEQQEQLLTQTVIERAPRQLGLFMGILTIVSAVIIALIIYTLTMDKVREIATFKLIGAPTARSSASSCSRRCSWESSASSPARRWSISSRDGSPAASKCCRRTSPRCSGSWWSSACWRACSGVRAALRIDAARALTG